MLQSDLIMLQSDLIMLQSDLLINALRFADVAVWFDKVNIHLAYVMTLSKVMPYDDFQAFLFAMFIYTEVAIGIATYSILFDETLIVIGRKWYLC